MQAGVALWLNSLSGGGVPVSARGCRLSTAGAGERHIMQHILWASAER